MIEIVIEQPNGFAFLFQYGMMKMRQTMNNGIREGFHHVYNKSKLERETDWSYFTKYVEEIPWLEYGKMGRDF